jgi:hypothetical protein
VERHRVTGLALAAIGALLVAAIVAVVIWTRGSEEPDRISRRVFERSGYVVADGGCLDELTAEAIDHFFAQRVGPVIGLDAPNVYSLAVMAPGGSAPWDVNLVGCRVGQTSVAYGAWSPSLA